MMTHFLWLAIGYLLAGYTASWLRDKLENRWGLARAVFSTAFDSVLILCIAVLIATGWLMAIRESQFKPHVVTTSINGRVLSSVTVTNPEYLTWEVKPLFTTNGLEYRQFPTTNYYWQVWSIFKTK